MPPLDLRRATIGDRVEHQFLVRDRAERLTRAGLPFVVLTLTNRSGTIETAPIWSEKLDWAAGATRGKIVHAVGDIALFGEDSARKRQLQLTAPLRVLAGEGYDHTDFLPQIDVEPEKIWDAIDKLRQGISAASIRRAVDVFFADDTFRVAFERAPGALHGHHARMGGLLLHSYEVASIARHIARTIRHANADLVVAGALLHDIGKLEAYAVTPEGFEFTSAGTLVGHVGLGALLFDRRLREAAAGLTPAQHDELLHFILAQRGVGDMGGAVPAMTVEAEVVQRADEASARATDVAEELADPDLFPVEGTGESAIGQSARLGRRLWRRPGAWD